jgi:hypothetical protein
MSEKPAYEELEQQAAESKQIKFEHGQEEDAFSDLRLCHDYGTHLTPWFSHGIVWACGYAGNILMRK